MRILEHDEYRLLSRVRFQLIDNRAQCAIFLNMRRQIEGRVTALKRNREQSREQRHDFSGWFCR